jgi:hypothetical protein
MVIRNEEMETHKERAKHANTSTQLLALKAKTRRALIGKEMAAMSNRMDEVVGPLKSKVSESSEETDFAATPATKRLKHSSNPKVDAMLADIVGNYSKFSGPFGEKPVCYVDWTASGRAMKSVENYIDQHVLPLYGNTHTTTSITGYQSSCFRHEARQIIAG